MTTRVEANTHFLVLLALVLDRLQQLLGVVFLSLGDIAQEFGDAANGRDCTRFQRSRS